MSRRVPPSGGSLEIGNCTDQSMWSSNQSVPPSGGSLEIGNVPRFEVGEPIEHFVPPSGGSLEIGNIPPGFEYRSFANRCVPPSGGSLEIGNYATVQPLCGLPPLCSPFGGIPRNWKLGAPRRSLHASIAVPPSGGSLEIGNHTVGRNLATFRSSPFGGIPRNWKLAKLENIVEEQAKFPLRGDP